MGSIPIFLDMLLFLNKYKILRELKFRFIYLILSSNLTFLCFFFFFEEVLYLLTFPFLSDLGYLINTGILENFYISIYIAMFLTFLIILPFFFSQFWFFIVSALYSYENKLFLFFLIFFVIFILFLFKNYFLLSFFWIFIQNLKSIKNWCIISIFLELKLLDFIYFFFYYICLLLFFYLLIFSFIIFYLINFITIDFFLLYRKYIYIYIYAFICVFFPPDFFSQIFFFFLFFFFFEILIFIFLLIKNKMT